jgi:hypothetical protein
MLLTLVYSLLRVLLDILLVRGRSEADLQAEVLLLRGASLEEYVEHYNLGQPHRSLGLRAPLGKERLGKPIAEVVCRSRLSGMLHEYSRMAA